MSQTVASGTSVRARTIALGALLLFQIPILNIGAQVILSFLARLVDGKTVFLPWEWDHRTWMHAFSPSGAVLISIVVLAWEAAVIGYERSSLKKILNPSPSARVDLFYLFVYASNLKAIFGILFSLGSSQVFYYWLIQSFSTHLISNWPYLQSLFALSVVNTFCLYWIHRILHTRLFWPVHKVHHSATELVMITNFRNHPLTLLIELAIYAIAAALLGASPEVELSYLILNGIYQQWAHSQMDWRWHEKGLGFIQSWLLIAPEDHRLHHSKDPRHWNRNFGSVPLWDKLFGTWTDSRTTVSDYPVGLDDENDQHMLATVPGFFVIMGRFLRLSK